MKKLKLFPKTFLYTFALTVFVVLTAHLLIFLLAPQRAASVTLTDPAAQTVETLTLGGDEGRIVLRALKNALPLSLVCSLAFSALCSLFFSRALVTPLKRICAATERMKEMDREAVCQVPSGDEIGILAQNVNGLYLSLLSTIEHLEREKERVGEMERAKAEFLRAASHELKTPVTALSATLENMILGVGKYQNHAAYLPKCREMVERLSAMIHDILETSKWSEEPEPKETIDVPECIRKLCEPYQTIALAHHIAFSLDLPGSFAAALPGSFAAALPGSFAAALPVNAFEKAVSNVLSNAVAYAREGGAVSVYLKGRSLVIENECEPIPEKDIPRLFEPFYRPDFSRDRESGGNGLGLYIVRTLLNSMCIPYSFAPMASPPGMRFTIEL